MKTVVVALKAVGIALLCLISIPFLFFLFILQSTDGPEIDGSELVHSQSFQHLHQLVHQLNNTRDIMVVPRSKYLPQNEYIVIDKLAINLAKRTFGSEPTQGVHQSYELASMHKFSSLDSLLAPRHLDSTTVYQITGAMKTTNIEYVEITYKVIAYRWKPTSWRYSEEGILYVEDDMVNRSQYKLFEAIGPNFYHYARLTRSN
ncbi:hypothetical protein [Spirosoma flavum]|uniref:Uncharacterized protein n=1 Tax=Spirosoma flavum TaxID=2048557 RepID=A0ABW6AQ25_9BACT